MKTHRLGATDIVISPVILGAMDRGAGTSEDRARFIRTLHAGLDAGITTIDTAPMYGFGTSETWLASGLEGRSDPVVIMTKVGLRWDDPRGEVMFETDGPHGRVQVRKNSRPDSIRHEVEQSLRRLGVQRLDVVQVHQPDLQVPVADTMGTLLDLHKEGKLAAIGVSNFTPSLVDAARAALGEVPLAVHQPLYNLLDRDIERDVLPQAVRHGISVVSYSPLAEGLLSGKILPDRPISDYRRLNPRFSVENRRRILQVLQAVVAPIADAHHGTVAQVALAWLLHVPGVTAVIAGASRPEHIRAAAAASAIELSEAERRAIRRGFEDLVLDMPSRGLRQRLKDAARRVVRKRPTFFG